MTRFSRPQAPQPAFRNPLDTRRADIQTLPRYASRCWSVLSFSPIPSLAVHIFIFPSAPGHQRRSVSSLSCTHPACSSCSPAPRVSLPSPRLGSSGPRTSAHRTNRPRIPALIDCQCSDPSCEQVQDSCIQSTLIPNIPVPRTSLENLRRAGLLCQSASE